MWYIIFYTYATTLHTLCPPDIRVNILKQKKYPHINHIAKYLSSIYNGRNTEFFYINSLRPSEA